MGNGPELAAGSCSHCELRTPINVTISASGMVAILRLTDGRRFNGIVDTLVDAGVRCLEVTLTSDSALALLEAGARRVPEGVEVGMGTVISAAHAGAAIDSGAQFVVSPNFNIAVVNQALAARIPVYPGALTPSEIISAWDAGASAVKLFPAGVLGPGYLRQLRGPLPGIPLMPTGGIGEQNVREYLSGGCVAVGIGTPLIGDAGSGGSLSELGKRARRYLRIIADHRGADA